MRLILRWIIGALAIGAAVWLVPGIRIEGSSAWIVVALMAILLGFVNAIIRPILTFLSCGLVVITLGLFMFIINGLSFWLASWVAVNWFNIGFYVDGLWPAILGSIVVSIVTFLLAMLLSDGG